MKTTLKTSEIPEAVAAFAASGFDTDEMRSLMTLVENQSDYVQKRFWKMADEAKAKAARAGADRLGQMMANLI
jgi:fructose 1,6-bisphosphatase